MNALLRRSLLISSAGLFALSILPVVSAFAPNSLAAFVQQQAEARGGDDGGQDDSGDDSSDDSSHDSSDDSDDDSSGRDRDRDRNRSGDDDSRDDDSLDDDSLDDSDDDIGQSRGRGGDRDEIRVIVNENQLNGLLSGAMVPVDQNGKRLRFEVEKEHGKTEIKVRAPRGALTGVTVIPAP